MYKTLILSLFLISSFIVASAQKYHIEAYFNDDGLAQSQVSNIFQDKKGYLWIGTYGGLSKFNGNEFVNFSVDEGLTSPVVTSILETSKGEFFVGTAVGLFKRVNNDSFAIVEELGNKRIEELFENENGDVWIGTEKKLIVYDHIKYIDYKANLSRDYGIYCIFKDKKGAVWLGTNASVILKYENNRFKSYKVESDKIRSIVSDNDNKLFAGTEKGLFELKADRFVKINKLANNTIFSLVVDDYNHLWVSTFESGVYFYNGKEYTNITIENGLSNNTIVDLFFDRENNLWLGTYGGLNKLSNLMFVSYEYLDGVPILSILKKKSGDFLLGTYGKGLLKLEENSSTLYTKENSKLEDNRVWSLLEDSKGGIWVGSSKGLNRIEGNVIRRDNTLVNEVRSNSIYDFMEDESKNIWISSRAALVKFDGVKYHYFKEEDGLINNFVWICFQDSRGKYWVGTTAGVSMFNGNEFDNSLSDNAVFKGDVVSITEGPRGNIWFAVYGKGVAMYNIKSKAIETFLKKDGLKNESVAVLEFNSQGDLLIGSNGGLDKLNVSKYFETGKKEFKFFDAKEGFLGQECNQDASYKDAEGNIWIGTIKGIVKYDEVYDKKNIIEPKTLIELIAINNEPLFDSISNIELKFNQNKIHFEWIGISLTAPEKVMYQYMMEGVDEDWNPISKKTEITYPKLPPGDYLFKVKAANNDGVWNKKPVTFAFTIHPPWYYSKLAIFCYLVLIVGLIYGFMKYRMAKVLKEKKVLEAKVEERTHELRKEKEKVEEINKEVLSQKAIIEEKNKDITDSINYAKQIQDASLPPLEQIQEVIGDSFVLFMPKDIVSGDFYWFTQKDDLALVAAVDCTGHGVPGAFMSLLGSTALNQVVNHMGITKPAEILNNLNIEIRRLLRQESEDSESRDGMDLALCAIDLKNKKISYSGAYRPLFYMRNGVIEEIKADRFPVGGYQAEEKFFTNKEIDIKQGDCIYMFSDGIVDQFGGEKGKKYLSKRFKELLEMNHDKKMKEQYEIIKNNFITWRSNYEQIDDVLVIGIRF